MQTNREPTLRILFVEDSIYDFGLAEGILKKEFSQILTKRVDTKAEFLHEITDQGFDIVICDHNLPSFSSVDALDLLKSKKPDVPFVLLTGAMTDSAGVAAIRKGATDYVLKSNLSKLPLVVKNILTQQETKRLKILAGQELARRNEELFKINKELDSFVYSVSHNLRSPLRSLLGLLHIAKNEPDPAVIQNYHQLMESTIMQLDNTVQSILDYSRNARSEVNFEKVDLRQLIEENFQKMAYMPEFKNFSTEININQSIDFYSDKYRLSVVLLNLISNAIKYSDNLKEIPCIKIEVSVSKDSAVIDFSDNGIGISKSALSNVFRMFYRATEQAEGSGLGLYIVKEAVDSLKGSIKINSAVGVGTSFRIILPNHLTPSINKFDNSLLVDKY